MISVFGPERSDKLRFANWPCFIGNDLTDRIWAFLPMPTPGTITSISSV